MTSGRLGTQPLPRARPARRSLLWLGAMQLVSDPQGMASHPVGVPQRSGHARGKKPCFSQREGGGLENRLEERAGPGPVGRGKGRYQCPHPLSPGTRLPSAGLPLLPRP